ncbi:hypothetical protein G6O67_001963 [Ophiocordyceps sinensis]|nr:hypothetical protein G6O67_001963 [Ophiocordyceps sinensis]
MESLRAVSRHQCAITFDHQGRLVLQDLREPNVSNSGTAVTCNGRGGTKRRGFTWILSGAEFIASTELTIVIALDDHLKFRIVVAPHDIHSELYKEKVAQFRRAVATNGDGPSFQERDWQNPESSAALNGVQTPNSVAVWDPNL